MEGIRLATAQVSAFLHPSRAADVPRGLRELLNSLLLRYSDEFDGVVLAHLKPKILGRTAKILSGLTPYFLVKLTTQLLLFSPTPGMIIEGKVNKVEKDYIGVLVLGLFNTTIGVVDIRQDLHFHILDNGRRAWVSDLHRRHVIGLGSLIRFTVKSLQETEQIIDIRGAMVDEDTGCVEYVDHASSKSKRKFKSRSSESEQKKQKKLKEKKGKERGNENGVDGVDIHNHAEILEKTDTIPMSVDEPVVVRRHKKRKGMDDGQSVAEFNHKSKRRREKGERKIEVEI